MHKADNILIVAGTGRNSGKTSLVTSLIKSFRDIDPVALKISPHFHSSTAGLKALVKTSNYNIFRESSLDGLKDSSKMLVAGASEAYFIQVYDNNAGEAFCKFLEFIEDEKAVICESPALRRYIEPGVFIIADSEQITKKKELGWLYDRADLIFELGDNPADLDITFAGGRWLINK